MTATFDSVLEHALQLPVMERSRIAAFLIESVDDQEADAKVSYEWQLEINRRHESIQNGTAKLTSHEVVMDELNRKLVQQRASKT